MGIRASMKSKKALAKRTPKEKKAAVGLYLKCGKKLPEVRKEELDTHLPIRTCFVCDRTSRSLLMIAPGKFRCDGCYPGSANWVDYFERLRRSEKTDAGQMLYNHAKGTSCIKPHS